MSSSDKYITYKKSRFFTRLPTTYIYTPSHSWLAQEDDNIWRVGYTKFALRMLGDIVEYEFKITTQDILMVGEVVGWIEGFKAVSDLYSVITGSFLEENKTIEDDPSLVYSDPYNRGWLYKATGIPEENHFNVHEYVCFLDKIIDKMLEQEGT